MKRILYITSIFLATLSTQAVAQDAPIFPKGEKYQGNKSRGCQKSNQAIHWI